MPGTPCRILTIAPYRVLPPSTGGHWAVVSMHDTLGRLCQDHVLGTTNNESDGPYSFVLHPVFPAHFRRYLPLHGLRAALGIGRRYDATHIMCEHPYMAPLAVALSRKLRIPWSLRTHNIEADRFRLLGKRWWPLLFHFERLAMRAADAVFFITPEDCARAIEAYGVNPEKCHLAPFGTTLAEHPTGQQEAKARLAEKLSLDPSLPWLYFLGVYGYPPNAEAVQHIISQVYPRLERLGKPCEIIIAGKGLPASLQEAAAASARIHYTGFVDDLGTLLKACDIMLNPLTSGGGIKTKAVEALAYNKIVVSTENGAAGLLTDVCGDNLIVVPDRDWDAFAQAVAAAMDRTPDIPAAFYRHYSWEAIGQHVLQVIGAIKRG